MTTLPELPNGGRYTGYWRVSTEDQNPQMQIDALVAAGVPADRIYGDKMTGSTMNRPGWKHALSVTRDSDVLVVWKFDRIGRSLIGIADAAKSLKEGDIGLKSITEPIDTATPWGEFFLNIMASLAQMERDMISERTAAGMKAWKARGGKPGPTHRVLGCPARLDALNTLCRSGVYPDGGMGVSEVVAKLNAVKSKLKPVSTNSFHNWRRAGFPGWTLPTDEPLKGDEE